MKPLLAILGVLLGTLCADVTAQPVAWDHLAWGMTREDVRGFYPNVINVDGVFHLEGFAIGDVPFRASLAFTGSGAGLAEINLDCLRTMPDDQDAQKVLEVFREKYGSPSYEGRDAFLQYVWQDPSANVQLIWAPASDYSPPVLRIFLREPAPVSPEPEQPPSPSREGGGS